METVQQLTYAWNGFDYELQRDLSESSEKTTVASFIDEVSRKQTMWYEVTRDKRDRRSVQPPTYTGQRKQFRPAQANPSFHSSYPSRWSGQPTVLQPSDPFIQSTISEQCS